jgi:hypothetical protein
LSYDTYSIVNAPDEELNRSPASQVMAKLAEQSELFLTHFEYRHHLALPTQWIPTDRPDLTGEVRWKRGVLEEHKYLHFRYDQPLGSFHPGHRAKWTAHELCHGLLGFTWSPNATPFHNVLAARLSELLPVALWYFFDEVQLRRCPLHYLQGALFQDHCTYCERAAIQGSRLPEKEDAYFIDNGIAFMKREINAITRSRRFARPLPHRYATLDLNSDAMAYVAQNTARMEDESFRLFIELFHGPHTGMWHDLDELEDRLWGLTESLTGGLPSNPLRAGKPHWIAQDVAWRLLTVAAQCEEKELIEHLYQMTEDLARTPKAIHLMIQKYQALHEEYFLPSPQQVFAVGYDLGGGWGWDESQIIAGVASACPELTQILGLDTLSEQVSAFIPWDLSQAQRVPIGKRFARFLKETAPGPLSDLASYESCIHHPDPPDPWSASLAWNNAQGDLVRRCQGVEVLHVSIEIDRLLDSIKHQEDIDIPEYEHALMIVNRAGGTRHIAEISPQIVQALKELDKQPVASDLLGLTEEEIDLLKDLGAITPCEWQLYKSATVADDKEIDTINQSNYDEDGLLPDAVDLSQLGHFDIDQISQMVQNTKTHLSRYGSMDTANALSPARVSSNIAKFPINIEALSEIINQTQSNQEENEQVAAQKYQAALELRQAMRHLKSSEDRNYNDEISTHQVAYNTGDQTTTDQNSKELSPKLEQKTANAKQNKSKHNKSKHNKSKHNKSKHNKPKHNKPKYQDQLSDSKTALDTAYQQDTTEDLEHTIPFTAATADSFEIDEQRPIENSFEAKLRQELSKQRAEKSSPFPQLIAVGEDLSLYEELFDFKDFFKEENES